MAARVASSCCRSDGEHEARGLELEALVVDARGQGLELAPVAAEEVERIAHADRGNRERERELVGESGRTDLAGFDVDPIGRGVQTDLRQATATGLRLELGLRQCESGFRLLQARAVAERLLHERVERRALEELPPLSRNVALAHEALHPASAGRDGSGLFDFRRGAVARHRRSGRRLEIRAHGACRQQSEGAGQQRAKCRSSTRSAEVFVVHGFSPVSDGRYARRSSSPPW
jgi:hypothetical protein